MDCYKCVHRLSIAGSSHHSRCNKHDATIYANKHGVDNGWASWPLNFDPIWIVECDKYSENEDDKVPYVELDPLTELFAMLR